MALTTSNLVTRCEERFQDTAHEVVSAANWLSYLNEAYQEVNSMYADWPWMSASMTVTTAAGTASYAVGANEDYSVYSVYNATNDYVLTPLEGRGQFRGEYPDTDERGTPVQYQMFDDAIELFPTPDGVYSIQVRHQSSPTDLDTSTINPVWPNRYRRALVEYALSRAYMDDGNDKAAELYRSAGDKIIAGMVFDLLSGTRTETYPRIPDDWMDW